MRLDIAIESKLLQRLMRMGVCIDHLLKLSSKTFLLILWYCEGRPGLAQTQSPGANTSGCLNMIHIHCNYKAIHSDMILAFYSANIGLVILNSFFFHYFFYIFLNKSLYIFTSILGVVCGFCENDCCSPVLYNKS